jgi:hypothetical protein
VTSRRHSANAVARTVVDYGIDASGPALGYRQALERSYQLVFRGLTSVAMIGDKGRPEDVFGGALPYQVQMFSGLAGLSGNIVTYRDGGTAGLENAIGPAQPMNDAARRIFADRLRRRR